jgi:ubiquinol-cytochrome c reductase iron-sulfur subunit
MTQKQQTSAQSKSRRDFLILASGAAGAVGAASLIYPFINSMNPAADTQAGAEIDVELKSIEPGQAITVMWRGKPVFIRRRTAEEIAKENAVNIATLPDPQADKDRVQQPDWLIVIGVCTHLGCVPTGQKTTDNRGEYNGWFCPCHGSVYDASGRIRKGPAPKNLEIPPYTFLNATTVRIGQEATA